MARRLAGLSVSCLWLACGVARAYNASVVEFAPEVFEGGTSVPSCAQVASVVNANIASLSALVRQAAAGGAQIVVLPEYALQGPDLQTRDQALPFLVPVGPLPFVACGGAASAGVCVDVVGAFGCLAVEAGVDLVVDLGEVETCTAGENGCPADGRLQFNSQVAFLRNGTAVAKYRKSNLYYEPAFDPNPAPAPVSFTTSFGVEMGLLICFDMMNAVPTRDLALAVKNVAFSTWWPNYPPFLTGTQAQSGFARAYGLNLLAAGIGAAGWRLSGSGIYAFAPPLAAQPASIAFMDETDQNAASHVLSLTAINPGPPPTPQPPSLPSKRHNNPSTPLSPLAPLVFALGLFSASGTYSATAPGVQCDCVVSIGSTASAPEALEPHAHAVSSNATQYACLAASGVYNSIFTSIFCGILPCPSGTTSCFETDSIRNATASFSSASVRVTVADDIWTFFPQGALGTMDVLLTNVTALTPNATTSSFAFSSPAAPHPLLDLLILGLNFTS
jgi:predicted amidohydrolase